ncbi:hypothetical protein PHLGIDRAFT_286661 [Phlebiopsis gigantea 11061_1 CR5-6]|uniref:Uncharacterized protein n=1 Tax=Phlebiopsis gigantea (strain 11061_1 CR5-6) TaxID=745531 RepID=A0A0C3NDI1_PHLG1|nr:hypothetical protein PHLGIDRAFT_286661 [Phlebiopsis gigantea 11061_1 CR5-6]
MRRCVIGLLHRLLVFPALRIYAIWNRNTVLFLLVLLPNLVPFATNLYISIEETPVYIGAPDFVCTANYRQPNVRLSDKVDRCTRALVIISDFSVIILTWAKTYQCVRHAIKHDIESQLFMLVFRDGTIYFWQVLSVSLTRRCSQTDSALLAFNVITIATWSPMQIGTSPVIKNLLFTCTPILISRFLLNLRRAGQPSESILSGDSVFQSRLSFASNPENRITGNLGEELHGFIVDAEEEETDAVAYESHSSLQDPAAQEEDEPAVADEVGPQQDTRGEAVSSSSS